MIGAHGSQRRVSFLRASILESTQDADFLSLDVHDQLKQGRIGERNVVEQPESEHLSDHPDHIIEARTQELRLKLQQLEHELSACRQAEQALQENADKYRALIDHSSSIVLEWDPAGTVLYLNPFGQRLFGFPKNEVVGHNVIGTIVEHVDSSGDNLADKMFQVQHDPDSFYSSENENLCKNGNRVWIAWTNKGIYDHDGKLIKTLSVGIDRTEQKATERQFLAQHQELQLEVSRRIHAEAELRQAHALLEARVRERTESLTAINRQLEVEMTERLRVATELAAEKSLSDAIINSLPGVFYMFDKAGQLVRWNDEFALQTGIDSLAAGTHHILEYVTEECRRRVQAAITAAHERGQSDVEAKVITTAGERFYRLVARRLQIQEQLFLVGTGYDITDRMLAVEQLRVSESRFRSAFMMGAVAFVLVEEATGRLQEVNDHFLKLYDYERSEVIGRTSLELGMWAQPEARAKLLAEVQQYGQVENMEVLAQRKGGEQFWVQYSVSLLNAPESHFMLGAIVDISATKEAQQRIAEYVTQLEATLESTLYAVSSMIEMRDPYTAGHERRVGLIAADIAREMGWPENRCHQLALIGLVHDIGKIAIPAEILAKPGRLTPLEYEMVKTHAERGFEILRNVKSSMPVAEVVYQHHERMDGSGYPQGLRGDQILLEARVLAVADVLESMASHRPYRPALGLDAAIREVEDHRETLYDTDIVDAAVRLIREKSYRFPD